MIKTGRRTPNKDKTHCPQGHPYKGKNLITYIKIDGSTRRMCRKCMTERAKQFYWDAVKATKHPGKPGRPRKDAKEKG